MKKTSPLFCLPKSLSTLLWAGSILLILFGCAQQPSILKTKLNSAQHQKNLMQLNHWQIRGKLGFSSQGKKESANFSWQQDQSQYKLNLTSIIGTSLLKMHGDKQNVTLDADGETYHDTDASFLIWRITGWQIPVEQFPIWVKGQTTDNADVVTAAQGWVTQIQPNCKNCEDWLITYDNYRKVDNTWLPHTITFNNRSSQNRLSIRVNSWS